ncbi:hypothetical protein DICPUDRAFT_149913 [Dictyostelium purpureum]|uniref:Uncharacterized protein n=1 Tax=Dictyostelium purpureum TaxID=5786 RepID=F0ZEZ5_DICPU|nr:uncharacterized protein DICPUDRAFT_149913 [Dictyostelium purpureum]EGC37518.1 hypothetical protein DICPUDRAFT_149913 [Dictyostelium purpureum]|eukprot:XP_003285992.1 hypothetical protein DICPUDRAFT_149913 [Dictyostelium purpureum]
MNELESETLAATTCVICCILENYQTEGGITVPEPLRPFLGNCFKYTFKKRKKHINFIKFSIILTGKDFIPFVKSKTKQKK